MVQPGTCYSEGTLNRKMRAFKAGDQEELKCVNGDLKIKLRAAQEENRRKAITGCKRKGCGFVVRDAMSMSNARQRSGSPE